MKITFLGRNEHNSKKTDINISINANINENHNTPTSNYSFTNRFINSPDSSLQSPITPETPPQNAEQIEASSLDCFGNYGMVIITGITKTTNQTESEKAEWEKMLKEMIEQVQKEYPKSEFISELRNALLKKKRPTLRTLNAFEIAEFVSEYNETIKDENSSLRYDAFLFGSIAYNMGITKETAEKIIKKNIGLDTVVKFSSNNEINTYINFLETLFNDHSTSFANVFNTSDNEKETLKECIIIGSKKIAKQQYTIQEAIDIITDINISPQNKIQILKQTISKKEIDNITQFISKKNLNKYIELDKNTRSDVIKIINHNIKPNTFKSPCEEEEYINKVIDTAMAYGELKQFQKRLFEDITVIQSELKSKNTKEIMQQEIERLEMLKLRFSTIKQINSSEIIKAISEKFINNFSIKKQLQDMDSIELSKMLNLMQNCLGKINESKKEKKGKYSLQEIKNILSSSDITTDDKTEVIKKSIPFVQFINATNKFDKNNFHQYLELTDNERILFEKFNNQNIKKEEFKKEYEYKKYINNLLSLIKGYDALPKTKKLIFDDSIKDITIKENFSDCELNRIMQYNAHIKFAEQFDEYGEYQEFMKTINKLDNITISIYDKIQNVSPSELLNELYSTIKYKPSLFPKDSKIPDKLDIAKLPKQIKFANNKKFITLNKTERKEITELIEYFVKHPFWAQKEKGHNGVKIMGGINKIEPNLRQLVNAEIKNINSKGRILLHIGNLQDPDSPIYIIGYATNGIHSEFLEADAIYHTYHKFMQ